MKRYYEEAHAFVFFVIIGSNYPLPSARTGMLCLLNSVRKIRGKFLTKFFPMYCIQHCSICRPSDSTSTVSEDAGIEPRTVANSSLAARRSNHSARYHPLVSARSHVHSARSHPLSARSHPHSARYHS